MTDEVILEPYTGNSYGFSTEQYGEAKHIKCLVVPKFKVIRRENGEDITSNIQYITQYKVRIKDRLDGNEVFEVRSIKDVFGNVIHYEALT